MLTREELVIKLGERIIKLRAEKSLSQTQLAQLCNWDRQVLNKIEKGKINPSIFVIYQIAERLNISLAELLDMDL